MHCRFHYGYGILCFEIPILPMPISSVEIHTDCRTALAKAYSQAFNGKSHHISLRHSLVQGYIVNEVITFDYESIKFNLADFFTKAMSRI